MIETAFLVSSLASEDFPEIALSACLKAFLTVLLADRFLALLFLEECTLFIADLDLKAMIFLLAPSTVEVLQGRTA
jgi:hypothetical protein